MPKRAKELSAIEVGRLVDKGLHSMGVPPGLHLQVSGVAKSWVLRVTIGDKRRDMGLGSYPGVTLAHARQKAREAREIISQGRDPIAEREAAQSALKASQATGITFDAAFRQMIEGRADEWRNAKHAAQWTSTLTRYASPIIGPLLVQHIEKQHVLSVLEPIWKTKTETARRVRGRIEVVLDWAAARGHREGLNPARWKGHLDQLLQRPSKIAKVEHHPAMSLKTMGEFMSRLRKQEGLGARALEFAILTAARSGEVRGALWSEIDLQGATWSVPAYRMKAGQDHRVPLSAPALELLGKLPRLDDAELLFPSIRGTPLSDATLNAVLRRMKVPVVTHGFRSTFRDWAAELTSYPRDLAEMALAHKIGDKVEAAYRRGDMLERRLQMMEDWAKFCSTRAQGAGTLPPIENLVGN